jgi:choline dehydrogenase-like flavoprotein
VVSVRAETASGRAARAGRSDGAGDEIDVLIVGAGAAGAIYAARLAQAGRSVLVLEAGPPWTLDDLQSSQIWSRRLKWGGAPVQFEGDHQTFPHNLSTGWGVGGAALHHFATWPRMPEIVFRLRSETGRGLDWPFGYDALRPWYDKVQADVGVAGDAGREPWRPPGAPYPMPGLPKFAQGEILERGFDAKGLATAPLPAGITTTEYRGRPACQFDGWCEAGCPIGSLANPLIVHLPEAKAAGAEIRPWASVLRLIPGRGDRVAGVEYADAKGELHRQRAQVVVLAASAVQNPRILLNSRSDRWPEGAGNGSNLVGRLFMLDAVTPVFGMFEEETDNYLGVPAGQLMHRSVYRDRADGSFGSYQWQIASSMKPNDMFGIAISRADIFGQKLHDFVQRGAKHLAMMGAMVEQLPDRENRVTVSAEKDRFGAPLAKVVHSFGTDTPKLIAHCQREGLEIMEAAGAQESWLGPVASGHIAGGTIMGTDPSNSVTDGYGRLHEVENVVLSGAGLFPTTGATSPTFTLMALAERSADHIARNWASYAA